MTVRVAGRLAPGAAATCPSRTGGNVGFIRNARTEGLSLIAILVVTDEEDCSVKTTDHLKPAAELPPNDPARAVDINLRCFMYKEDLYDLKDRYLTGFRALRPGNENMVVFAAIVGVPPQPSGQLGLFWAPASFSVRPCGATVRTRR